MFYFKFYKIRAMNRERRYGNSIALRLEIEEKQQLDQLIQKRKFRNLSEAVRVALKEFLKDA